MKKLLFTFFFGYASYKYRRLIRAPIILIALGIFIGALLSVFDSHKFPDEEQIELVYGKYWINVVTYNGRLLIFDDNKIAQLTPDHIAQIVNPSREEFVKILKTNDHFLKEIIRLEAPYWDNPQDYRRYTLGIAPIDWEDFLIGLLVILSGFTVIGFISYIVEPFVVEKKGGAINSPLTKEREKFTSVKNPISKPSFLSSGDPKFIALERQLKVMKSNLFMNKAIRILIRVIVFIGVYIPLFTIPFYSGESYLTPVAVLIAFFLSRPLAKAIISKWLPSLNN